MNNKGRKLLLTITTAFGAFFVLLLSTVSLSADFNPITSWGWTHPVNMSANLGTSSLRKALVDSQGNLHVLWRDDSEYPFIQQLLYRVRTPDGVWSPVQIVPGVTDDAAPHEPVLTDDGALHIVHPSGNALLYNVKPVGADWTQPITVDVGYFGTNPPLLRLGSTATLHAIWGPNHYLLPSLGAWTIVATDTIQHYPVVIDHDDLLHQVWVEDGDIYYATQAPNQPRSQSKNVSDNLTPSESPTIALDQNGGIHIAWRDLDAPNNYGIFYRAKIGNQWTQVTNVTEVELDALADYQLTLSPDGTPHIVWRTGFGLHYVTKTADATWTPSIAALSYLIIGSEGDLHQFANGSHRWKSPSTDWQSFTYTNTTTQPEQLATAPDRRAFGVWTHNNDIYYAEFYPMAISSVLPLTLTNPITPILEIKGSGYISPQRASFGSQPGDSRYDFITTILDFTPNEIRVALPTYIEPGPHNIFVENLDGNWIATNNGPVTIKNPTPVITQLIPSRLSSERSSYFEILGDHFYPGLTVLIGTTPPREVNRIDHTRLYVFVSAGMPAGYYTVTVTNVGADQPTASLPGLLITQRSKTYIPLLHKILHE